MFQPFYAPGMSKTVGTDPTVPVSADRVLSYREYGDPNGAAVVNCHGGLLCGLDVAPFDAVARDLGLRIISPDRPGLGASTAAPERTTGTWADDVAALLDALAIGRCSVFGWSMGGQYALACGARLADRVDRVVVVAGALPLDDEATFAELNAMDRRLTRLSLHHPHVASDTFRMLGEVARRSPHVWAHLTTRGGVPDDVTALDALPDPGIAEAAAVALEHGHGMVEEYRAWVRPWGFTLADVAVPTVIWQGDADELVPPAWGDRLAEQIADARLERGADAGHFLTYARPADVLGSLRA
jgi:pimeloyl-ACP methyl ester carboxylesterase